LFEIGPVIVHFYGVLVALGIIAGYQMMKWAAIQRDLDPQALADLTALLVFSGLLGARLFYVVLNISYYKVHVIEVFKIWEGGLVFYGGFLSAAAVGQWFVMRKKLPLGVVADCTAPALAIGQAIGRLGCFMAGCCYGKPTSLPWGVQFKDSLSLGP